MKYILYCGMSPTLGGIESFVMNIYRSIDRDKIQIDFLKCYDQIYFEDEILAAGSKVYRIPKRTKYPFSYLMSLITFFRNHPEYSVIHFHINNGNSIEPAIIAKSYGRKVISHCHTNWKGEETSPFEKLIIKINKKLLPYFTDAYFACSHSAGDYLFPGRKYKVIPNAIDTQKYQFDILTRAKMRLELGVQNRFVVGHIARFCEAKNYLFLLDIFQAIHNKNPDSVLLLVGDGKLRTAIEEKILQLDLKNSVILTGVRTDVMNLLQAMDVFVFPSYFEGLGTVLIEAQASGLKCFASDTIPHEAKITDLIQFIPLSETAGYWAEQIVTNGLCYQRKDNTARIQAAGYDADSVANQLEKFYLTL